MCQAMQLIVPLIISQVSSKEANMVAVLMGIVSSLAQSLQRGTIA